jgi:phosphate transport system substrate-binding protein
MARFNLPGIAGALALVMVSSTAAIAQEALDGVLLRGGGSSFAAPLYQSWIAGFGKQQPGLQVEYDSIGSGEGIARFVTGSLDFGGTDAPLTAEQIAQVEGGALQLPTAGGMIAICYNLPGFAGELRLPRDVYAGIFDGSVTSWNDERITAANPGLDLPRRTIAVVTRRDGSGTTFAFTNHLAAIDATWREAKRGVGTLVDWPGRSMTARGNEGVAATILQAEYSIGYVEYGFAKRLGLSMASLENRDGRFVAPALASAQAALASEPDGTGEGMVRLVSDPGGADAYPLVTLTWAMVNQRYADPKKAAAVRAFLGFGLGDGQAALEPLGYVRLADDLSAASRASLATVR